MARFVIFPGTAGSYADTGDINKVDADTAHLQQSLGQWDGTPEQATWAIINDPTGLVPFGDKVGQYTSAGTGVFIFQRTSAIEVVPVSSSTEYTWATWWYNPNSYSIWVRQDGSLYTSVPAYISDWFLSYQEVPAGTGVWIESTVTTGVTAAWFRPALRISKTEAGDTPIDNNDLVYQGPSVYRAGSDGTFVPSLRIVGDLDLRAKVAATDWDGTPTDTYVVGRWGGGSGTRSYAIRVEGSGDLEGVIQDDGGSGIVITTTSGQPAADGVAVEAKLLRVASTGGTELFIDDVSIDTTAGTAGPIFVLNSRGVEVGSGGNATAGAAGNFTGDIFWAEVRDGIDGPIVGIFDAEDIGL